MATIYEAYVRMREAAGLRDCDVSKGTGIRSGTFSDWKAGRYQPKAASLIKIAKFFGVPFEDFISGNVETIAIKDSGFYGIVQRMCADRGITIMALEEKAGLAKGSITKWRTHDPSISSLRKISDTLGVDIIDFFVEKKAPEKTLTKEDLPKKILQGIALAYQGSFLLSDVERIMADVLKETKKLRLTLPIEDDND